jgi:general secretion pathway protein C
MLDVVLGRFRLVGKLAPFVATLLALALFAWVLAYWVWRLWLPAPKPPAVGAPALLAPQALAQRLSQSGLFAPAAAPVVVAATDALPSPSGVTLKGVYAPVIGGRGFAIVERGGQTQLLFVGEALDDGLTLASVASDHVLFERQGERLRLNLIAQPVAAPAQTRPFALEALRLGEGRYGLSRSAFLEAAKDPASFAAMGRFGPYPRGGVVLLDSGTLLTQLGFKTGDVLTHLDGRPLRMVTDAGRLFQDIVARERVGIQALREGRPVHVEIEVLP